MRLATKSRGHVKRTSLSFCRQSMDVACVQVGKLLNQRCIGGMGCHKAALLHCMAIFFISTSTPEYMNPLLHLQEKAATQSEGLN